MIVGYSASIEFLNGLFAEGRRQERSGDFLVKVSLAILLSIVSVFPGCAGTPRNRYPSLQTAGAFHHLLFDAVDPTGDDIFLQRRPWPVTYLPPDLSNRRDYELLFVDRAGVIQNHSRGRFSDHNTIRRVIEVRGGTGPVLE